MKYRADIDGIRAFAVLAVILFHFDLLSFQLPFLQTTLGSGFTGVDVFFVISGYLITHIIYSLAKEGKFSFVDFYERRIRRIFPAFLFVMFCTMLAAYLLNFSQVREFSNSAFSALFMASNFLFWRYTDYFAISSDQQILLHTWSLGIEEQFYFFFPILVLFLIKIRKSVFKYLTCLWILSFVACIYMSYQDTNTAFYLLPFRWWELSTGSLLAILFVEKKFFYNNIVYAETIGIIGMCFMLFSFVGLPLLGQPFPSFTALFPCLGALLLIESGRFVTYTARFLSLKPFVFIGKISFSLYLWHWCIYVLAKDNILTDYNNHLYPLHTLCALILTFLLSILTYYIIEQPIRKKKAIVGYGLCVQFAKVISGLGYVIMKPFVKMLIGLCRFNPFCIRPFASILCNVKNIPTQSKSFFKASLTFTLCVLLFGLIQRNEYLPLLYDSVLVDYYKNLKNMRGHNVRTLLPEIQQNLSGKIHVFGNVDVIPTVLVYGDSFAEQYLDFLDRVASQNNISGLFISMYTKNDPFLLSKKRLVSKLSDEDTKKIQQIRGILAQYPIKSIFVSMRWGLQAKKDSRPETFTSTSLKNEDEILYGREAFEQTLNLIVETYAKNSPHLYLIYPTPEFPWAIPTRAQTLLRSSLYPQSTFLENLFIPQEVFYRNQEHSLMTLSELKETYDFVYINLTEKICKDERCYGVLEDGRAIFRDNIHLNKDIIGELFYGELYPIIQSGM